MANEYTALTRDDVQALRTADNIVFQVYRDRPSIRCIKKVEQKTVWDDQEKEYHIDCKSVIRNGYSFSGESRQYTMAFTMLHSVQYDRVWGTIAEFLRVGDELALDWYPDAHTNDYMKNAGLHGDVVFLHITREVRGKEKRYSFLLDTSCCPSNSARMVK